MMDREWTLQKRREAVNILNAFQCSGTRVEITDDYVRFVVPGINGFHKDDVFKFKRISEYNGRN